MTKRLTVIKGPDAGKLFVLCDAYNLLFGRGKHADSRLSDLRVSRVHCEVELLRSGKALVTDLESSGTFVNGQKISEQVLKIGDVVRIGETEMRYEDHSDPHEAPTVPPPGAPPARPVILSANRLNELTGSRLSHYDIGVVIARGNSGLIFKAQDFKNDRLVALKVLFPEFSQDEDEVRRFVRAMKTMMPLRHPNLVALYGAGKTGPYCWVAMELVEGEGLNTVIPRLGTAGMLDWRKALRVAYYLARALEYAHGQNVIHRNLTPNNVLVGAAPERTKLGDLMLAKAMEGKLAQQITKPGEILGDVRYMAPERAAGGTAAIDARADLYGLGALTYALLTGRPPFEGDNLIDTLTKIRKAEPIKPKKYQLSIPDPLEGLVLRVLAKRPEERPATATALLKEMEKIARYQGLTL